LGVLGMTQEELDALMAGDLDEEIALLEDNSESKEETKPIEDVDDIAENYKLEASGKWPPPPPTDDHKVVTQLDDVTKDSEKKATEIFDKLEVVNNYMMDIESGASIVLETLKKNIDIFDKLSTSFTTIETFQKSLKQNREAVETIENIISNDQMGMDEIMMIMDVMQYQDIHRQKIERVVNVMRALSSYMNSLFHSDIEDESRVSSANHIHGDTSDTLMDEDDIEALIASFGKK
jgi:hypothetical protein